MEKENKKLSFANYMLTGSMLFGLFFGAGNLIFPVSMGQNSGRNTFFSNLGFLITAVILPFLGIVAIGITKTSGVYDYSSRVSKPFAKFFTTLLYSLMGPFFILPRLAATSFTIGIKPFVPENKQLLVQIIFAALYFLVIFLFSSKPSGILDYVGKYLNPAFLVFLGILLVLAFAKPMGDVSKIAANGNYKTMPFAQGITDGYNTLDITASLIYGVLAVNSLKSFGLKERKDITRGLIKSGSVVILLMVLIYSALSFAGAMSLGKFKVAKTGGDALAQIANHYLGTSGGVLLAAIVILATLKTGIGVTTSIGKAICKSTSKVSYIPIIAASGVVSTIFANVGLETLTSLSVPLLVFISPLAVVLVAVGLLESVIGNRKSIYVFTTILAGFGSFFDALKVIPENINLPAVAYLLNFAKKSLPLFEYGFTWVVPAIIGFIIGYIISLNNSKGVKENGTEQSSRNTT